MRVLLWWIGFTLAGIWAQFFIPGVDFLVAGLLISLQEERWTRTMWVGLVFVMIQEGIGATAFGAAVLWYSCLVLLFLLGRWLFESRSPFYIVMLSLGMAGTHYLVVQVMAGLQDIVIYDARLFWESVLQFIILPLEWAVAHQAYKSFNLRHARAL